MNPLYETSDIRIYNTGNGGYIERTNCERESVGKKALTVFAMALTYANFQTEEKIKTRRISFIQEYADLVEQNCQIKMEYPNEYAKGKEMQGVLAIDQSEIKKIEKKFLSTHHYHLKQGKFPRMVYHCDLESVFEKQKERTPLVEMRQDFIELENLVFYHGL